MANPSISIETNGNLDSSAMKVVQVRYSRSLDTDGKVDQSKVKALDPIFARAMVIDAKTVSEQAIADFSIARGLVAEGNLDKSKAGASPRVLTSIEVASYFSHPLASAKPGAIKAIDADGLIPTPKPKLQPQVALAMEADGHGDFSKLLVTKVHREFLPPPPMASLFLVTSYEEVPLHGAKIYAGDSFRINLTVRGYRLDALTEGFGPSLLFTVKQSPDESDVSILFRKSTIQPYSGIGIMSVTDIATTTHGILQELKAQIRIYPDDTKNVRSGSIYYELELIDPLSERFTFEPGSFTLLSGVRGS